MLRGIVLSTVLSLCIVSIASAVTINDDWKVTGDRSWFTASNWNQNAIPTIGTAANGDAIYGVRTYNSSSRANGPLIDDAGAQAIEIRVGGAAGKTNFASFEIAEGGTLLTQNFLMIGPDSSTSGGRNGEFYMTGGSVTLGTGTRTNGHFYVGYGFSGCTGVTGKAYISNGYLDVGGNFSIGYNAGTIGEVYLSGGTIKTNAFTMKPNGGTGSAKLDISGNGLLLIKNDVTGTLRTYIDNGLLTANGNKNDIRYDITSNAGYTTVWAVPEPATMALLGVGIVGLLRKK